MSNCPNCKKKLRLLDLGQYCPHCGVNMRFCGFEEQFFREAKQAELGFAGVHIKLKRFKAAFIGSKLTVARLCTLFLPLVSLLIPSGKAVIALPFLEQTFSFNAMGLYGLISGGGLAFIGEMSGSELFGSAFSALQTAVFAQAALALLAALVLLLTILCFINIKTMSRVLCVVSGLGILCCGTTAVLINSCCSAARSLGSGLLTCSSGFGFFAAIAAFAVVLALNLLIARRGVQIEYDEGDLERYEISKQIKAGTLKLDDLPQPVVETAATRKIDEEIRKEHEAFEQKKHEAQHTAT